MSLQTPLNRIEGLGSAKAGTKEFWHQRVTAIALAPLAIWFVWSALSLVGSEQSEVVEFLGWPVNTVLMLLFVGTALYHMMIGMQVIIEDYFHGGVKIAFVILNKFFCLGIGAAVAFALLKIAFAPS
jgi:succinate dehydrogenase / fumarate reductase membrane anchor subunit